MFRTHSNYLKTHDRYLCQGQEADNEVKGEGNSVNFSFRMHDPRLGRFFAIDPLASKYPYYSPYSFSGNRVVDCKELEGLEPSDYRSTLDGNIITLQEFAGSKFQMDEIHITNEKITFSGLVTYEFVQFSYIEKTEPTNSSTPVPNTNQGTGMTYVPIQNELSIAKNPITEINDPTQVSGFIPPPGALITGAREFSERADKMTIGDNSALYKKGWNGNQYVKTTNVFSDAKAIKNIGVHLPIIGDIIDGYEIIQGAQEDGYKGVIRESAGAVAGTAGGTAGAWAGAALGTAILPGVGTAIGALIGGVLGSWGAEAATESVIYSEKH